MASTTVHVRSGGDPDSWTAQYAGPGAGRVLRLPVVAGSLADLTGTDTVAVPAGTWRLGPTARIWLAGLRAAVTAAGGRAASTRAYRTAATTQNQRLNEAALLTVLGLALLYSSVAIGNTAAMGGASRRRARLAGAS